MVEFAWKFEIRGIIIARVNSIRIIKSINLQLFTLIWYGVGGPLWCWHLWTNVSAQFVNTVYENLQLVYSTLINFMSDNLKT